MNASGLEGFRLSGASGDEGLRVYGLSGVCLLGAEGPRSITPKQFQRAQTQYHVSWEQSAPGTLAAIELPRHAISFAMGAECSSCLCQKRDPQKQAECFVLGSPPPRRFGPQATAQETSAECFLFDASCRSPSSHWTKAGEAQTVCGCFDVSEQAHYPENQQHAPWSRIRAQPPALGSCLVGGHSPPSGKWADRPCPHYDVGEVQDCIPLEMLFEVLVRRYLRQGTTALLPCQASAMENNLLCAAAGASDHKKRRAFGFAMSG